MEDKSYTLIIIELKKYLVTKFREKIFQELKAYLKQNIC